MNEQEFKEIKPLEGLGKLKFGLTRDEVIDILGEPNDRDRYSLGEGADESESWHYDDLGISMSFDEDDGYRLITIAVSSPEYLLDGRPLVNFTRDELMDFLQSKGITDISFEDAETIDLPNHELISANDLFLNVWLEEDKVKEVQWSPEFDDNDEVRWPE